MSDIIKVVVDAMGGDNAPQAPIKVQLMQSMKMIRYMLY